MIRFVLVVAVALTTSSLSDREQYQHLYDVTHGFSKAVAKINPDGSPGQVTVREEDYVCFLDKKGGLDHSWVQEGHIGFFFTFRAIGYSKWYADEDAKPASGAEQLHAHAAALETIQKTFDSDAPYILLMRAEVASLMISTVPKVSDGAEFLQLNTYDEGVKTAIVDYRKERGDAVWISTDGRQVSIGPDLKFSLAAPRPKDDGMTRVYGACEEIPPFVEQPKAPLDVDAQGCVHTYGGVVCPDKKKP